MSRQKQEAKDVESPRANGQGIRPVDEDGMKKLLLENPINSRGLVLRLAWLQGLSRDEICGLLWTSVDLEERQLVIQGREIPLDEETEQCLRARQGYMRLSPYVVISDKHKKPYAPEAISNMVRAALDREGMTGVRLQDLRHDFILRQIREHDWTCAVRVSGLSVTTFQAVYAKLGLHNKEREEAAAPDPNTEYYMWKLLQEQKDTVEGLALRLRWQMDLQLIEMVALVWDDIDFSAGTISLPTRAVTIPPAVLEALRNEREGRAPEDDPHVLLTPRSRKSMDAPRLSKLLRTAMIRANLDDVTIRDLRGTTRTGLEKNEIMKLARSKRGIILREVCSALNIPDAAARLRLKALVREGRLVKVRSTYYPAESTVPPERHEEVLCQYLLENGRGYLVELAVLLGLQERQCGRVLDTLVAGGALRREGYAYLLPAPEERSAGQ